MKLESTIGSSTYQKALSLTQKNIREMEKQVDDIKAVKSTIKAILKARGYTHYVLHPQSTVLKKAINVHLNEAQANFLVSNLIDHSIDILHLRNAISRQANLSKMLKECIRRNYTIKQAYGS